MSDPDLSRLATGLLLLMHQRPATWRLPGGTRSIDELVAAGMARHAPELTAVQWTLTERGHQHAQDLLATRAA